MAERRALVSTDIVDSTRLAQELGDAAMSVVWQAHDAAARGLLRIHSGQELKKSDGFLVAFDTVERAVEYAFAYHRALKGLAEPLFARIGIHVGEIASRTNAAEDLAVGAAASDVEGLAVAIVVRTMSVAHGGQTLATRDAVDGIPGGRCAQHTHGHWRLKGLAAPIELIELAPEADFEPPPIESEKAHRVVWNGTDWVSVADVIHTIPAARDRFVGRRDALAALLRHVDAGARLICIVGTGGTGKTRLVQHFAQQWLGGFAGGAWFCDLTHARSSEGLLHAVAQGLQLTLGRGDHVAQIGNAIARRGHCLVILDNFEQVVDLAPGTVGNWLDIAGKATFVVTSRETLGLPGEVVHTLQPLTIADGATLFRERASAVDPDAVTAPDDDAAVERIVALLDGLPLAIELAAARARLLSPHLMIDKLARRLEILTSRRGRTARQSTLRAAFDWSWDLLGAEERVAFAHTSVFDGSFTLEAAAAVLAEPGTRSTDVAFLMQSLLDKSLLRTTARHRFECLATLKEYAGEKLAGALDPAAQARAHERHWSYYARLPDAAIAAHDCADVDNIVTACRRATAQGDAACAVGALRGSWVALGLRGPYRAAHELASAVRDRCVLTPAHAAVVEWVTGSALAQVGHTSEAREHFDTGLAFARAGHDARYEAILLGAIGGQQAAAGSMHEAEASLVGALALARAARDRSVERNVLNRLGVMYLHRSRLPEARDAFESAITIARALGDLRAEGGAIGNLGSLLRDLGDLDGAGECYERAIRLASEVGDRTWEGNARCNLGLLHHDRGRYPLAREEFTWALRSAQQLGHVRLEATVLCNLGMVAEAEGQFGHARDQYERAVSLASAMGDRRAEGQFRTYLGALHGRCERATVARECLERAIALLESVADTLSLGLALCALVRVDMLDSDLAAADATLARASTCASELALGPDSELSRAISDVRALRAARGAGEQTAADTPGRDA